MQPHYTCLKNCLSTVGSNHRQCPECLWYEAYFFRLLLRFAPRTTPTASAADAEPSTEYGRIVELLASVSLCSLTHFYSRCLRNENLGSPRSSACIDTYLRHLAVYRHYGWRA